MGKDPQTNGAVAVSLRIVRIKRRLAYPITLPRRWQAIAQFEYDYEVAKA